MNTQDNFRGWISLLAVLALTAAAPRAAEIPDEGATRRLALVIGSHEGGQGRDRLIYAGSDAAAFRRTLEELGGLREGDATLLVDPDSVRILRALDDLEARVRALKRAGSRVEALVYYSGHANEKGLLLGTQGIDYRVFRTRMNSLGADVRIAVVDACESGALTRLKGGHTAPAFLVDKSIRSEGYAILTSSSESESAQESDRVGGSFFTNALNSGLRGAADASRDGKVTLHEAYQFAYNETLARTETSRGGPQHAGYDIQLNGSGDVVLTDLRQGSSFADLSEDLTGRLFIRDSTGHLVAELQKPAGRDMRLGLSAGVYEVRLLRDGAWRTASVTLPQNQATLLTPATFRGGSEIPDPAVAGAGADEDADADFHYVPATAPGGFSSAILYDWVKTEWRGIQLAPIGTGARSHLRGGQLSLALNSAGGDLEGFQASIGANFGLGSLHGMQFSSGTNIVAKNLRGAQFGTGANIVGGAVTGFQGSVGLNTAGESMEGWQAAVGANLVGAGVKGGQVAVGFNIAADSLKGGQASVGFNVASGRVYGGQGAVGFNIAGDALKGGQGAVGFNVAADDLKGGQGAVGFNIAAG
ncbi:MAG: peptidase caspase catalytic subunit p20, partial [Fibrobacteria bacterium]|nr:peptidase caspase catalytic subunit p20 [Fibrobacteria bacterium]